VDGDRTVSSKEPTWCAAGGRPAGDLWNFARTEKRAIRYDKLRYRGRHLIENAFCRLKDFRRLATRYDKLADNFLSGVALATANAFWL
jgi:transposase